MPGNKNPLMENTQKYSTNADIDILKTNRWQKKYWTEGKDKGVNDSNTGRGTANWKLSGKHYLKWIKLNTYIV